MKVVERMHHAEHLPNVLLLDTSNQYCSVALQWRGQLTARHEWSEQKHSQMILPMVRELLAAQQATFADLDAIAVGVGPGGFTGVRLAVSVAQGLAFAAHKPVLALSSLAALAVAGLSHSAETQIIVAMDARMQQVYWAHYEWREGELIARVEPSLDDVAVFVDRLNLIDTPCVLVGNAIEAFDVIQQAIMQANDRVPLRVAEIDHSAPHAADFAPLVNRLWSNGAWQAGVVLRPEQVQPLYVRDKVAKTIAEREAEHAVTQVLANE